MKLFRIAFQYNPLLDSHAAACVNYVNIIDVHSFLILRKQCTSSRSLIFLITQENYLIIFERVDKLSRKKIYLRKILDLDYEFGLRLLDFTAFGLGNTWTTVI